MVHFVIRDLQRGGRGIRGFPIPAVQHIQCRELEHCLVFHAVVRRGASLMPVLLLVTVTELPVGGVVQQPPYHARRFAAVLRAKHRERLAVQQRVAGVQEGERLIGFLQQSSGGLQERHGLRCTLRQQ